MNIQFHEDIGGDLIPKLNKRYINQDVGFEGLTQYPPSLDGSEKVILEKNFPNKTRKLVQGVLKKQYRHIDKSEKVLRNLEKLVDESTFTVCTGQQLHPLMGPLFFATKILDTIKLAQKLSAEKPNYHFVPVFWMAGEDHDFEEINTFKLYNESFRWDDMQGGAVGRYDCSSLMPIIEKIEQRIDNTENNQIMMQLIRNAYQSADRLDHAMQILLNNVFGDLGLLVLNPDDTDLKELFYPIAQKEMEKALVQNSILPLKSHFKNHRIKWQLNPREINLFKLGKTSRSLIKKEGTFLPADISPNAALRPIYQELILPNVVYVAGPSELNYWLQLGAVFLSMEIQMPIVFPRQINYFVSSNKWNKLGQMVELAELMTYNREELLENIMALNNTQTTKIQYIVEQLVENISDYEKELRNMLKFDGRLNKNWAKFQQHIKILEKNIRQTYLSQLSLNQYDKTILKFKEQSFNNKKMVERETHIIDRFDWLMWAKQYYDLQNQQYFGKHFVLNLS